MALYDTVMAAYSDTARFLKLFQRFVFCFCQIAPVELAGIGISVKRAKNLEDRHKAGVILKTLD